MVATVEVSDFSAEVLNSLKNESQSMDEVLQYILNDFIATKLKEYVESIDTIDINDAIKMLENKYSKD